MKKVKAHIRIRRAMRRNEREVVARLRRGPIRLTLDTVFLPWSWSKALDRLEKQGRVRYSKTAGGYVLVFSRRMR